ncbi:MAG: hypothetical protein ACK4ZX_00280 [Thermus sp.]
MLGKSVGAGTRITVEGILRPLATGKPPGRFEPPTPA